MKAATTTALAAPTIWRLDGRAATGACAAVACAAPGVASSIVAGGVRTGATEASHSVHALQTVAESGIACPHDEHCFTASHLESACGPSEARSRRVRAGWRPADVEFAHGGTRREQWSAASDVPAGRCAIAVETA